MVLAALIVPFGVCMLVVLPAYLAWNVPHRVATRKLARLQAAPIGELKPGDRAKVSGELVLREVLEAPISLVRCAFWRVDVREKDDAFTTRAYHWSDMWEGVPFVIDDGTGTIHVDPSGMKLALLTRLVGRSSPFDNPTPAEAAHLRKIELPVTSTILNRNLYYREASLRDGERVSVAGVVSVAEVDGELMLTLIADDGELLISNAPAAHG